MTLQQIINVQKAGDKLSSKITEVYEEINNTSYEFSLNYTDLLRLRVTFPHFIDDLKHKNFQIDMFIRKED